MNESIKELLAEYYEALRGVRELKVKARKRQKNGYADLAILKSMEEDLEWVIAYMLTGKLPMDRSKCRNTSGAFMRKIL